MAALHIRPDIARSYASLFGEKTVNGQAVRVETLIASLTAATAGELSALLAERHAFQDRVARGDATEVIAPG